MKRFILTVVLVTLALSGFVSARLIPYDEKIPPRLTLADAYPLALQAMGEDANKFHCTSASIVISRSPDGEWLFTFCDKGGTQKHVFVFFDKQVQVESGRLFF